MVVSPPSYSDADGCRAMEWDFKYGCYAVFRHVGTGRVKPNYLSHVTSTARAFLMSVSGAPSKSLECLFNSRQLCTSNLENSLAHTHIIAAGKQVESEPGGKRKVWMWTIERMDLEPGFPEYNKNSIENRTRVFCSSCRNVYIHHGSIWRLFFLNLFVSIFVFLCFPSTGFVFLVEWLFPFVFWIWMDVFLCACMRIGWVIMWPAQVFWKVQCWYIDPCARRGVGVTLFLCTVIRRQTSQQSPWWCCCKAWHKLLVCMHVQILMYIPVLSSFVTNLCSDCHFLNILSSYEMQCNQVVASLAPLQRVLVAKIWILCSMYWKIYYRCC